MPAPHPNRAALLAGLCNRRDFLAGLSAAALTGCANRGTAAPIDIVDTHTHFYDPKRPQGVPWPPKDDTILYRSVLPPELKALAQPLGITGTIVIEASPWEADNQWVLDLAVGDPFILGVIGHLKPGWPGFAQYLDRFAGNPLFRGIRAGGWGVSIAPDDPGYVNDLRLLAERNLAVDVLIGPDQLEHLAKLAAKLPELRIIVDHCANVRTGPPPLPETWTRGLHALARHSHVYMKVSGLVEGTARSSGAPADPEFYCPVLDCVWECFGEDRVIFGSNWPVSARFADYPTVLRIVREYFHAKGPRAAAKYFSTNAARAYRWVRRTA